MRLDILDTTLRDGSQAEGISFSVEDKLAISKSLARLGVAYIEAGNPGSNPKDLDFFSRLHSIDTQASKVVAFGATRRKFIKAEDDENLNSLLLSNSDVVAIFGKSWDFHVEKIINCDLAENLLMIKETIAYLKGKNKEVIFDAEHFFDGYKSNPEYAMQCLQAAVDGNADVLCLCETNGGCFPHEVEAITKVVVAKFGKQAKIGIHAHNDSDMAVANSIASVLAGATHVQGTLLGFGERCGNANLVSIIVNMQLKKGYRCIPPENLRTLTGVAKEVAEIANIRIASRAPFVGRSAFAHKGGMHVDGVRKNSKSFEHLNPETIGGKRRFLVSEVGGKSLILEKALKIVPNLKIDSQKAKELVQYLKEKEFEGYVYEGADASFALLIKQHLGLFTPSFELKHYKIIAGDQESDNETSSAIIKILVDGKVGFTAAEGNGPVNALDEALRKVLEEFYPCLKKVNLIDYKVRVLNQKKASQAKVRVLITSGDDHDSWTTVGVSTNIIQASWIALVDSLEYKLMNKE